MTRAPALPRDERRAALVDTTLTLVRERASVPSTREIADAAGVAEGTIFRAFATKEGLLSAAVEVAFCPAPLHRELEAIDPGLPLRARLVAVTAALQRRLLGIFDVMAALGLSAPPSEPHRHGGCASPDEVRPGHARPGDPKTAHARTAEIIVRLIEPDAGLLTCTPPELAHYLRLLTFSGSHRHIADGRLLTPETIVDLLLTGVVRPKGHPC